MVKDHITYIRLHSRNEISSKVAVRMSEECLILRFVSRPIVLQVLPPGELCSRVFK